MQIFKRKQGIGQASLVKQASRANWAGSPDINRPFEGYAPVI